MRIPGILLATTLGLFASSALADPLSDRNLPSGKLLHQNATERYYGAYVADGYTDPAGVGVDPQVVQLKVFAFRKPSEDGSLVKVSKVVTQDAAGTTVDGYQFDASELALVNDHLAPAVDRLFPDRRFKNVLTLAVYSADAFYANVPSYAESEQPDLNDPEAPVLTLSFFRSHASAAFVPGYVERGLEAEPAAWFRRGIQDLPPARKRLPDTIAAKRSGQQVKNTARYLFAESDSDRIVGINNPDGLYLVSEYGTVTRLKLFRARDEDGSFAVDAFKTTDGAKMLDGWWYPDTQQFWAQEQITMPGNEQCNQLSTHRWTHTLARTVRPVSGRSITVFEETASFGKDREPRTCVNARVNPETCQILFCNRYEQLEPRFIITESESDAIAAGKQVRAELDRRCAAPASLSYAQQITCAAR